MEHIGTYRVPIGVGPRSRRLLGPGQDSRTGPAQPADVVLAHYLRRECAAAAAME